MRRRVPVLWPPHAKSWLIGKDSDAGRDWGQEEKGMTEDEMAGWHHWLDGSESGWTLGVGDGQGGLACCDSWGHKESDTTEQLIWSDLIWSHTCLESICSEPQNTPTFCFFLYCHILQPLQIKDIHWPVLHHYSLISTRISYNRIN